MKELLLVVDMQNDFVKGHMSTPESHAIIDRVVKKCREYQERGALLLFTMDTHLQVEEGADRSTEARLLPEHCVKGSEGWNIIEELRPWATKENTLQKPTFLDVNLSRRLAGLVEDVPEQRIELCGVCTDICVLSNALYLRALYPAATIMVDGSCCAGLNEERHEAALSVLQSCLIEVE